MSSVLEIIGIFALTLLVSVIGNYTWRQLYLARIGKILGRTLNISELGSWAVVTGATDGIGKAYVEEFAQRGINVVLISRSLSKLESVAADLQSEYGIQTKIIDADFTEGTQIYTKISKIIEGLDIGILVNNVGVSYDYPEFLTEVADKEEFFTKLVNCNIYSVVRMTFLVLPQMVRKRKGLILNISSITAAIPTPLVTMYSSSKAFVLKFSQDLAVECKEFNVNIQCALPGWVVSKMSRIRKPTVVFPTPKKYVREQLNTIGLDTVSSGYWAHSLQLMYYRFLVFFFGSYAEEILLDIVSKTRDRALRRRLKENVAIPSEAAQD